MPSPSIEIRSRPSADSPVRSFLDEFWATTQENWLNPRQRIVSGVAGVEVCPSVNDRSGTVHITDIVASKPGEGQGRAALTQIVTLADKHGVRLDLIAKTYVKGRLTSKQLRDWYSRYGFQTKSGNARDGYCMVRPAA